MIPHYNFLRKPAADFGWDWGPAFAPAGIFGGILLVVYDTVYITGDCKGLGSVLGLIDWHKDIYKICSLLVSCEAVYITGNCDGSSKFELD